MNTHTIILHALTRYDERESKKAGYNRYVLPHYLGSLQEIDRAIERGTPVRRAILGAFNGWLADTILRAVKEPMMTRDERRGW